VASPWQLSEPGKTREKKEPRGGEGGGKGEGGGEREKELHDTWLENTVNPEWERRVEGCGVRGAWRRARLCSL
jgi:hypothetical protein